MGVIPLGRVETGVCPTDKLASTRSAASSAEPCSTSCAAFFHVLLAKGKSPVMEKHSMSHEAVRKGAVGRGPFVGRTWVKSHSIVIMSADSEIVPSWMATQPQGEIS